MVYHGLSWFIIVSWNMYSFLSMEWTKMCVNPQDLRSQIFETRTFSNSCFSTSCSSEGVGWNEDWQKCKLKIEITKITYIRLRYLVDFSWMISLATVSWLTKVASQPCFRCVPLARHRSHRSPSGAEMSHKKFLTNHGIASESQSFADYFEFQLGLHDISWHFMTENGDLLIYFWYVCTSLF